MTLLDVNILVYAFREDVTDHDRYLEWLETLASSQEPFGAPDVVFSGFLRIVTHPKVFAQPSPTEIALVFAEQLRSRRNFISSTPGPDHWRIFARLCRDTEAKGNLIPDAFLAAYAIESDADWITADRDFARFAGLRWRHPFE